MEEVKLYRPILKNAWQITKKFKALWFFGLFAAILSSGGEFELISRIIFNSGTSEQSVIKGIVENFKLGLEAGLTNGTSIWSNIWTSVIESPTALLSALLVMLITITITAFIVWLAVVSQVGLVRNIDLNSKNKKTTVNEGIDKGVEKFWPILIVNAIYKLIILIVFILLGKEILLLTILKTTGVILHIVSLVIFSIITVIVSFLVRYQLLYMILKNTNAKEALKSSYDLFKNNWLVSIEMAFILFIVYFIITSIAAFVIAVLIAVPMVFLTGAYQIPVWAMGIIGLLSFVSVFIVTFFTTAILSTFQWSSWTLLFNKISSNRAISKIVKLSDRSPNITVPFRRK
jgi:hypothetical protein